MNTLLELNNDKITKKNELWRVLVVTNKGQFFSPETFENEYLASQHIKKLKEYHKSDKLFQRDGVKDISPKFYLSVKVQS